MVYVVSVSVADERGAQLVVDYAADDLRAMVAKFEGLVTAALDWERASTSEKPDPEVEQTHFGTECIRFVGRKEWGLNPDPDAECQVCGVEYRSHPMLPIPPVPSIGKTGTRTIPSRVGQELDANAYADALEQEYKHPVDDGLRKPFNYEGPLVSRLIKDDPQA